MRGVSLLNPAWSLITSTYLHIDLKSGEALPQLHDAASSPILALSWRGNLAGAHAKVFIASGSVDMNH